MRTASAKDFTQAAGSVPCSEAAAEAFRFRAKKISVPVRNRAFRRKVRAENGFSSLLVLSGETTAEMYEKSETRADAVLASLNDVVKYL